MLCVKMTALDMHDCEDLDSEFQMRYRGEDISTVPCFIADFGRVVPSLNFFVGDAFPSLFFLTFH